MSSSEEPDRPVLRVIRGDATDEEIAALLAVVLARSGGGGGVTAGPRPTSVWSDRASGLRRPVQAGPGAWRASAWQR
jgi:hypothetical protein